MPEGPHPTVNLRAGSGGSSRSYVAQAESEGQAFAFHENQRGELTVHETAGSLKVGGGKPGQGYPAVAFAIQERAVSENPKAGPDGIGVRSDDCAYTLEARQVPQSVAFNAYQRTVGEVASPIMAGDAKKLEIGVLEPPAPCLSSTAWRVRRLTPEECEILQGFPVGYTLIPVVAPMQSRSKAKPRLGRQRKGQDLAETVAYLISLGLPPAEAAVLAHSPDGPRYKALGNSWAVPCARWIAQRIDARLKYLQTHPCAKALSVQ
jgi:DNA (cytosine-5)-methyltransferase 1